MKLNILQRPLQSSIVTKYHMKIFPIKVEKYVPLAYKFVEWKIHNVCNYNCSFCGLRHKDGSQRWFSLDQYKEYVDKLVLDMDNKPFWIQITGGEPTLFPKLIDLLVYMKQKNAMTSLITNGSRTLRYFNDLKDADCLDHLFVTYHSEQTGDYHHIADVLNMFHDKPIDTICLITHVYNSIEKAFLAQDYMINNTGALVTLKAMVIGDYNIYELYTPEQKQKLLNENYIRGKVKGKVHCPLPSNLKIDHTLRVNYNNLQQKIIDPQVLLKEQANRFRGYTCEIGMNNLRIDHDVIYRGVCEVGGNTNLNDEKVGFFKDSVICTSEECYCGTDMIAKKTRPIHGNLELT